VEADAVASLERLPLSLVRSVASALATPPALLHRLALRFPDREEVALEIARNPAADDATVARLGAAPFPAVLEVIGRNQARLERSPETVAALLANPATPVAVVQLWQEHQERGALARGDGAGPPPEAEEADAERHEFAPVLVEDEDEEVTARDFESREEVLSAKQLSIYAMLKKMSMGQKVALAVKGNREVRNILIRENNKMLCLKVLENPRVSDTDAEAWAKSTNVPDDVLRGIANKKEWMSKYSIVKGLVSNPKAPVGVTLDLIKRLTLKDQEFLAKNRNVPETIRTTARRLVQIKRERNQ
jgi:hypothetical protein